MQGVIRTTFVLLMALAVGCSGSPEPAAGEAGKALGKERMMGANPVISDDRLEEVQFRSLWTSELRSEITQAWFLGEDVYVTTRNGAGRYSLVKINGESGFVDWTFNLGGQLEFAPEVYRYPPELQETNSPELFLVQEDVIYCLDDRFGAENFRIELDFPVSTSIAVSQDHFFIGSWNRRMYAFSKSRRLEEWSYITDAPITAPPAVGGVNVYFGSEDNNIYQMNVGSGYQQGKSWIRSTGGKVVARPVFYNNRVYVGSWDYKFYCLDEYQGLLRWSYPSEAPVSSSVFPHRDWIFGITTEQKGAGRKYRLLSLDRGSGERVWEREGLKRVVAADSFHCYALDPRSSMHALRLEDGVTAWNLDLSAFDHILTQDADLGRARERVGRVYLVGGNGFVQAIQPRR